MKIIEKIINGIPVTFIKTKKFKSIAGVLCFDSFVTEEKMTTGPLLRDVLIYSTKKFDTPEKLNINSLENFGAAIGANAYRIGNMYTNSFYFQTLEDKYTEAGNLDNVIDTFCEIIFNPNVENGSFEEKDFKNRKKRIKESYERLKENQRAYAEYRVVKHLNKNKAYSYELDLDILNEITPKSLYENYNSMINNSRVSLLIIGDIDENDDGYNKIINRVKSNTNHKFDMYISNDDEEQKDDIIETSTGTQAVLHNLYYLKNMSKYELDYVLPIYRIIFGGSSSRLFNTVREEHSLAYYCFARTEKDDAILEVIAGIEEKNYGKAIKIIEEEKNKMNKVTEEEIKNAKKELISSLLESQDDILNIISRKKNEIDFNLPNMSEYINKINNVKKEEVENINNKIHLGFRYFLKGSDNNG